MEGFNEKSASSESKEQTVSLDNLIDPARRVPEEYEGLIQRQEGKLVDGSESVVADTEFAARWGFLLDFIERDIDKHTQELEHLYQKLDQLFRDHLSSSVLIDLGGGREFMKRIAYKYSVSTYINVDRNPSYVDSKISANPLVAAQDVSAQNLRQIRVKSDMLDFVSRLRPNAVNFVLNGIDELIIDNHKYHQALARELMRVAQEGSLIFGKDSVALEILAQHAGKENSGLKDHTLDFEEIPHLFKARILEVTR